MRFLSLALVSIVGVLFAAMSGHAAGTTKVIKLVAVQVSQKKPTKNTFVIKDNDFIGGKKAGHDTLTCSAVSQAQASCNAVFALTAGTIKAKFLIVFSASKGQGTITGGTGRYAGAKGRLSYRNLNQDGTRTAVVLTLT